MASKYIEVLKAANEISSDNPEENSDNNVGFSTSVEKTPLNTEGVSQDNSGTISSGICANHQKEKLFFCESHQQLCCGSCISNGHELCTVVTMQDVHFNFSRYLQRINSFRPSLTSRVNKLKSHSQRIESFLENGKTKIDDFYNEIRRKIDEAEQSSLNRLQFVRELELSGLEFLFSEYDVLNERIENLIEEGGQTDEHTDQTLTPVPVKTSGSLDNGEEKSHETDRVIARSDVMTNEITFSRDHEGKVLHIEKKMEELDNFSEEINMDFVGKNDDVVKDFYLNVTRFLNISSICPTNHRPVKIFLPKREFTCEGIIKSIMALPYTDGEFLVVTETPNKLQRIGSHGEVFSYVALASQPNDLCVYAKYVAVTLKSANQINIYHISDLTAHYQIKLTSSCWGICRIDDNFVVAFHVENAIKKVSDSGNIISVSDSRFAGPSFVRTSACGKYVLVSDTNNNRVVALSTCSDLKSVLYTVDVKSPMGLCTFTSWQEYMLVCSEGNSFVRELTRNDENNVVKIECEKYGINKPHSLCYNVHSRTLAVTSDGQVQLFRAN